MKLSGTGPAHRLDECEISVQEQRFSGGVEGPAKPAAKGFAADKPASGLQTFECCRLCIPSTNLVELGGSSWKFLFPFPRQIPTHFPPKMEVQRPYLNPTQFFRFCSKNTPFLPEGKN